MLPKVDPVCYISAGLEADVQATLHCNYLGTQRLVLGIDVAQLVFPWFHACVLMPAGLEADVQATLHCNYLGTAALVLRFDVAQLAFPEFMYMCVLVCRPGG
jgi:hypothetical protein